MKIWVLLAGLAFWSAAPIHAQSFDYRVLATNKTSTMEKELNETARLGFRLQSAMGGESAFGGKEVVVVMGRNSGAQDEYRYKLLATNKTSTMQKELQLFADEGYEYKTQTVFDSAFGGKEVVVVLERNMRDQQTRHEYRLLATNRTSTLDKELAEAGKSGFEVLGLTVGHTAFGGKEVVAILRRAASSH
jgi:hypothetical protein